MRYAFQSSPDPKAGRNCFCDALVCGRGQFQSSPDPKAGRNEKAKDKEREEARVPILARPEGRAQRYCRRWRCCLPQSSNPRPTRRPGATLQSNTQHGR